MRLMAVLTALACLPAGAAPAAAAVQASAAPAADFRTAADAILESAYPADGPGAAAIVTRGGRVVYAAGRGLADLETRRPVTPDTIIRLGSITKQFTAAVILQLVAEGRLSLDDPISRFFPDYPQPGARATVRQLLNHTSGIRSYTSMREWMTPDHFGRPHSTAEMIAVFRDQPSVSEPGQAWAYNNSGYILLGAIIERLTGRSWHQAIAERIARPLGLRTIAYGELAQALPAAARGYTERDGRPQPATPIHMSVPHAAGGLAGTVGDLARWAHALHHGQVVPPALYQEMIRPTRMPDGSVEQYGFGLEPKEVLGRPAIGHGGAIFGAKTDSLYIPSEDLFVAVFVNSDSPATDPELTVRRLAALALGQPFPTFARAEIDMRTVQPLLGVYRIADGVSRRFFMRDGKLYTQRDGGGEMEVFPAGDDRFFYGRESLTWFRIERREDGAHIMLMHQPDRLEAERAVRTGAVPAEAPEFAVPRALLQTYAGTYTTAGPGITIALREDGRLTVQLTGQEPLPLRAVSENEFEVAGVGARIVFHRENDQVNRLTVRQGDRQLEGRRTAP